MRDGIIPSEDRIFAWIEEIFGHGIRRPGYPADRWAEQWVQDQFRAFGLEDVRAEPVELPYWEPRSASLVVTCADAALRRELRIPCFPLPHAAPAEDVRAELVAFDPASPRRVRGAIALYDVPLMRMPHALLARLATWPYDPDNTFATPNHVLPFGREFQDVMGPAIEAGAVGFIGTLSGYPGDSRDYYVPYDGKPGRSRASG